ncbi:aminotransferase class I/II-fold pyridoxal phosphate-dependent enzyme [Neolewinella persica]|uniref:aminotransferase class I/II-fold pyridoxal phosphate-dependent enzyme n=1 Tax=Neolewinella persica TaxID=70998 RepID=UPI00036250E3|nr:aminotransferase class I/II-fold pyridoxal phosphate-dependent enzyme [Neolewinella persica]
MSKQKDPFDGFFHRAQAWLPGKSHLLNTSPAKRLMRVLHWGMSNNYYTYQQALEGKAGAHMPFNGETVSVLSAYDYLGLIGHPKIEEASIEAIRQYGTSTGGVRLLTGTNELHLESERKIAAFKGTEAALTFSSGYLTNVAVITALFGKDDLVLADQFIHRSLTDGLLLAQVPFKHFKHNDAEHLEHLLQQHRDSFRRILILVEGTYSMDGDNCPLPEIIELKKKHECFLMIDESHSFGVLGKNGRGVDEYYGVNPNDVSLYTASLSKTIPSNGGFVAGSKELIYYLQHGANSSIFSAALAPAATAATSAALEVIQDERWRLNQLEKNIAYFKTGLKNLGYTIREPSGHIVPLMLGSDEKAYALSSAMLEKGFLVSPIVHPAVSKGKARLRLCVSANYTKELMDQSLAAFAKLSPRFSNDSVELPKQNIRPKAS